jgi:glutamate-ammonia-ligase adenylyltransferase
MSTPKARSAAAQKFPDALAYSAYAARVAASDPGLLEHPTFDPATTLTAQAMLAFLDGAGDTNGNNSAADEARLRSALRRLRAGTLLSVMQRDLDGRADLAEVTATMTALADVALARTLSWFAGTMREEFGLPLGEANGAEQTLLAVGMGKLGGGELNVSSDIDLVFVYPEEGETDGRRRIGNHEYFTRLARRTIRALDDVTAEGRVFRVDMRLRPDGEAGALACGFDALEQYFVTQGREWERYAWIKARVLEADDRGLSRIVRPFVFRKYLDFGAFAAMRALHAQIRAEVARRELADHIKLGPGGIREIEFIAQVFQLIRGGREPALQARPTLVVLDALAERSLLPRDAAHGLAAAYDFLRRLEHRLQYLDDQQTHELPREPRAREQVAQAMGEQHYQALLDTLARHRDLVSRQFDAIFAGRDAVSHALAPLWKGEAPRDVLLRLGYADPEASAGRLATARSSPRYRQLGEAARARFDRLVPRAIDLAAASADPGATLGRVLDLLDAICRRSAYLALLDESQGALEHVVHLLAASPWAAQYLTQNPLLLDELLDPRLLHASPGGDAFERELRATLAQHTTAPDGGDVERQMDVLREAHHAQSFRLLARDLAGELSVEALADQLSDIADRVLKVALELCWNQVRIQMSRRFGATLPVAPRFAIIAYGKLGGKELGYESDLDLVFLFDDAHERAAEAYSMLAQRLVTWLASTTPAGRLFDVDLRLRPHGDAGLVVSSLAAFREYEMQHAWAWEHQAITRARFAAGDAVLGAEFEATRLEVLTRQRAIAPLKAEIAAMRKKMHEGHPNHSGEFDLKHDAGGMIDVEFAVQFLVLAYAHRYPRLAANLGNIALLGIAGELDLLRAELAARAQEAYRDYRRRQHALRLNGARYARVPAAEFAAQRAAVTGLWQHLFGAAA